MWKKDNDGWQQVNDSRPLERLQRAGDNRRSGPDGNARHDRRQRPDCGRFNLDNTTRGTSNQVTSNIDGYEGTYKTLEFSANKRYSTAGR